MENRRTALQIARKIDHRRLEKCPAAGLRIPSGALGDNHAPRVPFFILLHQPDLIHGVPFRKVVGQTEDEPIPPVLTVPVGHVEFHTFGIPQIGPAAVFLQHFLLGAVGLRRQLIVQRHHGERAPSTKNQHRTDDPRHAAARGHHGCQLVIAGHAAQRIQARQQQRRLRNGHQNLRQLGEVKEQDASEAEFVLNKFVGVIQQVHRDHDPRNRPYAEQERHGKTTHQILVQQTGTEIQP